jgi:hypothetical protein
MLIGLVLLLCLATVPLARGRLSALADVRFRASWLALVAIARRSSSSRCSRRAMAGCITPSIWPPTA